MTDHVAIASLAGCMLITAFVLLQLATERRRSGVIAMVAALVAALIAATAGSYGSGFGWVTDTARRTDAIGLGITFTIAAAAIGIIAGRASRTVWAQAACCTAGLVGIVGALAAVAIGRATAHWEFVAIVTCGVALALVGSLGASAHAATMNRRILLGAFIALGVFTALGGTLLGITWTTLA